MCTLTWTTDGSPPEGYSLWFNRDERLTRGPELPPRTLTTPGGVSYIAPEDSEAGGTWITANEFGVTVAVLNGYLNSLGPRPMEYRSRGALVRDLAGLTQATDAFRWLSPALLGQYRPMVLCVKAPGSRALVARWNGLDVQIDPSGERQLPLTSSSYEQDDVQRSRADLYRRLVLEPEVDSGSTMPDARRLEAFQNYVDPVEGPTAFSPTMARGDAATRSQCRVEVTGERVSFVYVPGPPHATDPLAPLHLMRSTAAPGSEQIGR